MTADTFDVSDAETVAIATFENERMTVVVEDEPPEAWTFALVDGGLVYVNDHYEDGLAELDDGVGENETVAWDDLDGQRVRLLEVGR